VLNNQIVSDPVNCVDWRIYQTANAFGIDSTRKYQVGEGSKPSWPVASYGFLDTVGAAEINFTVLQNDLDSRQCNRFTFDTNTQWECFFELAFVVQGVTQASYYFSFRVTVSALAIANNLPSVDFVKIIQVARCPADGSASNCQVNVRIPTSLWFCSDSTCNQV
jgi:hypothetical protein